MFRAAFIVLLAGVAHGLMDPAQKQGLVNLYNALNGPNWYQQWTLASDPCLGQWYGVSCDTSKTVLWQLVLDGNNITGTIPSVFSPFVNLTLLSMKNNHLSGTIPADAFANTSVLSTVKLTSNALSGPIPASVLGRLGGTLDLSQNQFTGPLPEKPWGFYTVLLNNNSIDGTLPANLTGSTWLSYLDLSFNRLSGTIPPFDPNGIYKGAVNLHHNQLSGSIPSSLGTQNQLSIMDLSYNKLNGTIPSTFSGLANVRTIHLDNNELTGPIDVVGLIGQSSSYFDFYAWNNRLNGTIPQSFLNLGSIGTVDFHNNQLVGTVPDVFLNMARLNTVDFSYNNLSSFNGTITVPQTTNLVISFDFSYNFIQGALPIFSINKNRMISFSATHNGINFVPNATLDVVLACRFTLLNVSSNPLGDDSAFAAVCNGFNETAACHTFFDDDIYKGCHAEDFTSPSPSPSVTASTSPTATESATSSASVTRTPTPSGTPSVTLSPSVTATLTATPSSTASDTVTPTASATGSTSKPASKGLSGAEVGGIVGGSLAAVVAAAGVFFFCKRRKAQSAATYSLMDHTVKRY